MAYISKITNFTDSTTYDIASYALKQKTISDLKTFNDDDNLIYAAAAGSNTVADKPTGVDAFGVLTYRTAAGWYGQLLTSSNQQTGMYWRTGTSLSGGWKKLLDSTNYTDYTVEKDGTGATGTWDISISGNAATADKATKDSDGNAINTTYLKKSGGTMTGNINRYYASASSNPMITALANNQDITLFTIGHGTAAGATTASNHYKLLYKGTGSSPNNYLQLIAHNTTDKVAMQVDENANVSFTNTVDADISGNAATATKFAAAQSISLTGDTTGSASSQAGWSIATTTDQLSYKPQITTLADLDAFGKTGINMKIAKVSALDGHTGTLTKNDGMILAIPWSGGYGHQFYVDDNGYGLHHRYWYTHKVNDVDTVDFNNWVQIIDSNNYTNYTVKKDGTGATGTWGISITGNAATATKTGVASMWTYSENNNELNFGGTNNSSTIYIGYRAKDSKPIPTKFIFGSSTGTADLQAKTVYLGSGTSSYISSTNYTGNAATVTVTKTTPTNTTTYYPVYTTSTTTGAQSLRNDTRFYYYDTGTTSYLNIGNTSNSGGLTLHNANGKYGNIVSSAFTDNRTFTLPNKTGTFALTSDLDDYLPLVGGTLTGPLYVHSLSKTNYIAIPDNGFWSADGSKTGAIKITLPVSWSATMMSMKVDVYNYNDDNAITYTIGGYNYSGNGGYWTNCSASSIGKGNRVNLTVRFGHDGTKCCIIIGETNTTWSYPKAQVRDVMIGHSGTTLTDWTTGWTVSLITTLPDNIDVVKSDPATIIAATKLTPIGTTAQFWRGDNSWSDTLTDKLTVKTLTISSDTATTHLNFSRTGGHDYPNYINVPANSSLAFSVGGSGGSNIVAMAQSEGLVPFTTNTKSLGTSSYKWANAYITTTHGNLEGTATSANSVNLYEARATTTTLNKTANYVGAGKMFHLVASSSTSATDNGKTATDANILQMNWDNSGGYDSQFGISTSGNRSYFRSQVSAKTAWREYAHIAMNTKTGSSTQPVYVAADGKVTTAEHMFPIYYSNLDYTSTAPVPGAYTVDNQTNPVTGVTEYGSALSLPGISSSTKHYAAQLLISSPSGQASAVHGYIRRLTSSPSWSNWSTLLDDKNFDDYTVKKSSTDGAASQVAYYTATNTIGGSSNFTWDATNNQITVLHKSGKGDGFRTYYGTTVDMFFGIGSGNTNHGIYDSIAGKWMVYADASGNVKLNGTADVANKLGTTTVGSFEQPIYLSNGTATETGVTKLLEGATSIAKNVDLNTFATPGNYAQTQTANAQTNLNTPFGAAASSSAVAFRLTVESTIGTKYRRQFYESYNGGLLAERTSTDTGANWSTWRTKLWKESDAATAEGSASCPVYINGIGRALAITSVGTAHGGTGNTSFTANRLVYSESATKLSSATSLYATANSLGVNVTSLSKPKIIENLANTQSTITPSFQVSGKSYYTDTLIIAPNKRAIEFRPDHASYNSYIYYGTAGNEALNFVNRNAVTSFSFWTGNSVNGSAQWYQDESGAARTDNPALQIKSNSVYINKLLPSGTNPGYKLYINGTTYGSDTATFKTLVISSTGADQHLKFSRTGSWNYITVPFDNASTVLSLNSSTGSANSFYQWTPTTYEPGTTYTKSLGTNSLRWKESYIGAFKIGGGESDSIPSKQISSNSTFYINRPSNSSVIFQHDSVNKIWIDTANALRPDVTNTLSLGTSTYRWKNVYIGTANTYGTAVQPVYWANGVPVACTAYSGLLTAFSSSTNTLSITVGGTTKTTTAVNSVSNTWAAGTTAGPTIKTTVNGIAGTAVAIPSASATASGAITTGNQEIAGTKTFINQLIVGKPTNTQTMPEEGIYVHDTRTEDFAPNTIEKGVQFFFTNKVNPVGNSWCGGIYIHPWTSGANKTNAYGAWCLTGPAGQADVSTKPLYVRTSKSATEWGAYRKIYDTSNKPTPSEILGTGTNKQFWRGDNTWASINLPYGATLPSSGAEGDVYLQTSAEYYELPTGGSTGQILAKKTAADRNVQWIDPPITGINISSSTAKFYPLGTTSNSNGTISTAVFNSSVYVQNNVLFGAAWNDYAEFRQPIQEQLPTPGMCVVETGDDTLEISTKRMQPGAAIVSDTYGFAIGKQDKAICPIAVSGRVLAYPYEDREEFKKNIGRPVCAGPNGTVSIMTDEEYRNYGYCAIGTISAVPNYETWGENNIQVNNRVWIKVR